MEFLTTAAFFADSLAIKVMFPVNKATPAIDSDKPFAIYDFGNGEFKEAGRKDARWAKLLEVIYSLGDYDELIVTLSVSNSILRLFEEGGKKVNGEIKIWGDYSSWCFWKGGGKKQHFYLFGEGAAMPLWAQPFGVPIEASTCRNSSTGTVFFGGGNGGYLFLPSVRIEISSRTDRPAGQTFRRDSRLSLYIGNNNTVYDSRLLLARPEPLEIYLYPTVNLTLLATVVSVEEPELGDIASYRSEAGAYTEGATSYAMEIGSGRAFGISSLTPLPTALSVELNTSFDPSKQS
ncbi:unnamed protein product [Tuber aestivum]|uniref:Uncharacterized protein n=1 Tax=Tuber aestivum TaxID=59557 RepID=A0A292Q7Z1_9PEZI|nr:unnamed protein product [Tuber aestivum]